MATGAVVYILDRESREKLLKAFPPKYQDIKLGYIKHKSVGSEKDLTHCSCKDAKVIGLHEADGLQVLAFEIDGSRHQQTLTKSGDKFYHVILSCDPSKANAKRAEEMISGIALKLGEMKLTNLSEPICVKVTAELVDTSGKTLARKAPEPEPEGPSLIEQAKAGAQDVRKTFVEAADTVKGRAEKAATVVQGGVVDAADGIKGGVKTVIRGLCRRLGL